MGSLSDRTKWFLVYSAILLIAVCNILVGQNWATTSEPIKLAATGAGDSNAPFAGRQTAPFGSLPSDGGSLMILKNDTVRPNAPAQKNAPIAQAPGEQTEPLCDVNACAHAYRSFRASDCTYLSNAGRRLCTKGQTPQ